MIIKVVPILNKILAHKKMTQTELAQLTGLPQGTISRFDRTNRREDINMFLIADALDIRVEDLFEVQRDNSINNNK